MSLPVRAVEGLDSLVRDRMQSHRLIIAPNICEPPNSVPMLTCLSDLRASMTRLSSHARRVLPERISGNGCRPTAYARTLQPLAGSENADRQCQERHRSAFDLAICTTAAVFASVTDMFYAARLAGVTLPQGKQKRRRKTAPCSRCVWSSALLRQWTNHHHHLTAFHLGEVFHLADLLGVLGDTFQQLSPEVLVCHLTATEA